MAERRVEGRRPAPKRSMKAPSSGPVRSMATSATVVVLVLLLLLILWFITDQVIHVMGGSTYANQPAVESSGKPLTAQSKEKKESVQSQKSEISSQESVSVVESTAPGDVPKPLVEGPADYQDPDTWVGKTFRVTKRSNVRSGPGTASEIINVANEGVTVTVRQASMEADAVWVQGVIDKGEGQTFEGWVYGWSLDSNPVE